MSIDHATRATNYYNNLIKICEERIEELKNEIKLPKEQQTRNKEIIKMEIIEIKKSIVLYQNKLKVDLYMLSQGAEPLDAPPSDDELVN